MNVKWFLLLSGMWIKEDMSRGMTFPVQVEATYWGAGLSAQTSAPLTERRTWMSTGSPRRSSSAAASARTACRFWTVPWRDKPFPGASRCFSTRWFYGEWAALVTCTSTGPLWSRSLSAVLVSSSSNGNILLVQTAAPPVTVSMLFHDAKLKYGN